MRIPPRISAIIRGWFFHVSTIIPDTHSECTPAKKRISSTAFKTLGFPTAGRSELESRLPTVANQRFARTSIDLRAGLRALSLGRGETPLPANFSIFSIFLYCSPVFDWRNTTLSGEKRLD